MGESLDGLGKLVGNPPQAIPDFTDGQTRADYMQGTRINFKTKEDAVHFAEKQGILNSFLVHSTSLFNVYRLGLLRATGDCQTNPSEELCGQLYSCSSYSSYPSHQVNTCIINPFV
jgi:hypothetical protein